MDAGSGKGVPYSGKICVKYPASNLHDGLPTSLNANLTFANNERAAAARGTYFYLVAVHLNVNQPEGCRHIALHPFQVAQMGFYDIFLVARLGGTDAQVILAQQIDRRGSPGVA